MRTLTAWVRYRLQRIPRKLRFAKGRLRWLALDARNGWRILWELGVLRRPIVDVTRYERRIGSQNGEDGILEAVFAAIGTTNRYFVEFGSGNLSECNTVYLARWKGWRGLWMDAAYLDRRGRVKREWVTVENIEALFERYGVPRRFDLLSIDVDGNDYWIWKAITSYEPRVVVIEYNASLPPSESRVIPYEPAFQWDGTDYYGASLLALARLGRAKGYVLVGCDSSGTNAFFVHQSLVKDRFRVPDVAAVYRVPTCFDGQGYAPDPLCRAMVEV
jgi:hypothetical protein